MITISFYSYKGGVGRSLALTNLAVYLAQFGATVAIADFDLEAPGLNYKLNPDDPLEVDARGLAGFLADLSLRLAPESVEWPVTMDVTAEIPGLISESPSIASERGRVLLIPAGNPLAASYWNDLARIDWDELFSGSQGVGVLALTEFKQRLVEEHNPDVLLVDSRTGITPGGGVATTLLPDVVVALLLNSREHIDGTRLVIEAVTSSGDAELPPPAVVPVLSRYTLRAQRALEVPRRALRGRPGSNQRLLSRDESDTYGQPDAAPLSELTSVLVANLSPEARERVRAPLLLHTDLDLQRREQLAFGNRGSERFTGPGSALLEDYLRLFAALVPRGTFQQYVTPVRTRVREILLDRPDDAVQILEQLAALVGDEDTFLDLVKIYVLRRDSRNLLLASERLFRVHDRVIIHPAITTELRSATVNTAHSRAVSGVTVQPEFAERYWREADPLDLEWGAAIARSLADRGATAEARTLARELVAAADSGDAAGSVIKMVAGGGPSAERLAEQLALEAPSEFGSSRAFVEAAAYAFRFRSSKPLAGRILGDSASSTLPAEVIVGLLETVGKHEEALELLVASIDDLDLEDPDAEPTARPWALLVQERRRLRSDLEQIRPDLARFFASFSDH